MAVLRMLKGSILEENLARTAGSIGESVAAGAIFTIPAFVIAGVWPSFDAGDAYWKSTRAHDGRRRPRRAVRLADAPRDGRGPRRCRIPNRWLRPRSTRPASAAPRRRSTCSTAWGSARSVNLLGDVRPLQRANDFIVRIGKLGQSTSGSDASRDAATVSAGGVTTFAGARGEPRLHRRRLHHRAGARLAELRGRRPGVGPAGAAADLLPRTAARSPSYRPRTRTIGWAAMAATSGASSCGRSRSAACSSARASRSSACARTLRPASARRSPSCRSRPPPRRRPADRALHASKTVFAG